MVRTEEDPLEAILCEEAPELSKEDPVELVARRIAENIDPTYQEFQAQLIPTPDARFIAGVRMLALRKIARELMKREEASVFSACSHTVSSMRIKSMHSLSAA